MLTITGTSLDGDSVVVTVDDTPCDVKSISQTEITCLTGKKIIEPNAQIPASYIGQQGLNYYAFSGTHYHDGWRSLIDTENFVSKSIYTAIDLA